MFQQEEVVSVQWLIEWSKKKKIIIFFYKIFTQTAKHWTFSIDIWAAPCEMGPDDMTHDFK